MANKNIIILSKMVSYAKKIENYLKEMPYEEFINNSMVVEASVFNLSQIGELVKTLDPDIVDNNPHIKWIALRNLRNRIVHDYEGIKFDIIWQLSTEHLSKLITDLEHIIKDIK